MYPCKYSAHVHVHCACLVVGVNRTTCILLYTQCPVRYPPPPPQSPTAPYPMTCQIPSQSPTAPYPMLLLMSNCNRYLGTGRYREVYACPVKPVAGGRITATPNSTGEEGLGKAWDEPLSKYGVHFGARGLITTKPEGKKYTNTKTKTKITRLVI